MEIAIPTTKWTSVEPLCKNLFSAKEEGQKAVQSMGKQLLQENLHYKQETEEEKTIEKGKPIKTAEQIGEALTREIPLSPHTHKTISEGTTQVLQDAYDSNTEGYAVQTKQVDSLLCVHVEEKGDYRSFMEDCSLDTVLTLANKIQIPILGVFDGHGGPEMAQFIKNYLPTLLTSELNRLDSLENQEALWHLFKELPVVLSILFQNANKKICGSTLCLLLFLPDTIWSINVGDSRAIAIEPSSGKVTQLTLDQTLANNKIRRIFLGRGGRTKQDSAGNLRAEVGLAIPRSVGMFHGIKGITSLPTLRAFLRSQFSKDTLFFLACDGVWDVFSSQTIGQFCADTWSNKMGQATKKEVVSKMTRAIVRESLVSQDNVSITIATKGTWEDGGNESDTNTQPFEE